MLFYSGCLIAGDKDCKIYKSFADTASQDSE